MTQPGNTEKPSSVLRAEHQTILRVVGTLDRLVARSEQGSWEQQAFRQCVEFFKLFADACHHAKEEDHLFPVLERRGIPREGGPIGVMLEEHRLARGYTQSMADALDAVDQGDEGGKKDFRAAALNYINLLRNHIHKEDNVLFHMGDSVMSGEDQTALCDRFCEVGCRAFGGKTREELEIIADNLTQQWS